MSAGMRRLLRRAHRDALVDPAAGHDLLDRRAIGRDAVIAVDAAGGAVVVGAIDRHRAGRARGPGELLRAEVQRLELPAGGAGVVGGLESVAFGLSGRVEVAVRAVNLSCRRSWSPRCRKTGKSGGPARGEGITECSQRPTAPESTNACSPASAVMK